jgi:hypothetical protein
MQPRRLVFWALAFLWCIGITAGLFVLLRYEATPGEQGRIRGRWPDDSSVARVPGCFNLVMALHPRCPCSTASVAELKRILAQSPDNIRIHVLVYRPSDGSDGWEETDLVHEVRKIHGVLVYSDKDAFEAQRFGAHTSGQVVLYGASGELLFRGGLTASRGHQGDSPSQQAVKALLRGQPPELVATPVFGCPLLNPDCRQELQ